MKRLVTVILTWICTVIAMEAQTFTDHLRRRDPKTQGVVTISQSAAIEQLVNGKGGAGKWASPNPNERTPQTANGSTANSGKSTSVTEVESPARQPNEKRETEQTRKSEPNKKETTQKTNALGDDGDGLTIPVIATRRIQGRRLSGAGIRRRKLARRQEPRATNRQPDKSSLPRPTHLRALLFATMDLPRGQLS